MKVLDGLNMNGNVVTTCVDVILEAGFSVLDHQMCIENSIGTKRGPQTTNHRWTKGQIGHEISVHDVEVKPIQSCIKGFLTVRRKVSKVGR